MELERRIPTPRARRIRDEIESLTVRDVVWMKRELDRLLGHDDPPDSGVREPRRPWPGEGGVGGRILCGDERQAVIDHMTRPLEL